MVLELELDTAISAKTLSPKGIDGIKTRGLLVCQCLDVGPQGVMVTESDTSSMPLEH